MIPLIGLFVLGIVGLFIMIAAVGLYLERRQYRRRRRELDTPADYDRDSLDK